MEKRSFTKLTQGLQATWRFETFQIHGTSQHIDMTGILYKDHFYSTLVDNIKESGSVNWSSVGSVSDEERMTTIHKRRGLVCVSIINRRSDFVHTEVGMTSPSHIEMWSICNQSQLKVQYGHIHSMYWRLREEVGQNT